jgi:hypothetical protein
LAAAAMVRQCRRAFSSVACGLSRKYSSEVPLEKQYNLPSSGLIQLSEQSDLILAPAATPSGSRLSNSPRMGFGGTAAFQMPPLCAASLAGACATAIAVVARQASAIKAMSGDFMIRRLSRGVLHFCDTILYALPDGYYRKKRESFLLTWGGNHLASPREPRA